MAYTYPGASIVGDTATILSGATTSETFDLIDTTFVGFVTPAAWTTATLNIEVSEDGVTWSNAYDAYGSIAGSYASIVVSAHYTVDYQTFIPWRYIRLKSSVSQGANRQFKIIKRVLA